MAAKDPARYAGDGKPRRRPVIAAALIAAVVVALLVLIVARVTGGDDDPKSEPPPAGPSSSPTASSSSDSSTSACGLPDGPQTAPTTAPKAEWVVGPTGIAYPTSSTFGPAKTTGGLHTCFAHNPTGALFAAVLYTNDFDDPSVSAKAIAQRFAPPQPVKRVSNRPTGQGGVQMKGFKFVDVTRDRVTVTLALTDTTSDGDPVAGVINTLAWQDGDWHVVPPEGGHAPVSSLPVMDGYVLWGGVS